MRDKDLAAIVIVMFFIMFFVTCNSCQKLNDIEQHLITIEKQTAK